MLNISYLQNTPCRFAEINVQICRKYLLHRTFRFVENVTIYGSSPNVSKISPSLSRVFPNVSKGHQIVTRKCLSLTRVCRRFPRKCPEIIP